MPGGRLAALTIAVAPDLDTDDHRAALMLGPSRVGSPDTVVNMLRAVGFRILDEVDETHRLREVAQRSLERLELLESTLREEEGGDGFEAEWGKKSRLLEGVDRGVLVRTLVVAEAP